jgi:hypothetical protein
LRRREGNPTRPNCSWIPLRSRDAVKKQDEDVASIPTLISLGLVPGSLSDDELHWNALARLAGANVSPWFLAFALGRIKEMSQGGQSRSSKTPWHLPQGMTQRQLTSLPARIDRIASTIESLNSHRLYNPSTPGLQSYRPSIFRRIMNRASGVPDDLPHSDPHSILELPARLKAFACYLRARTASASKRRKGIARGKWPEDQVKEEIVKLIITVKDITGEFCWAELSNLLYPVFSKPLAASAENLKTFYRQNKHHCANF